VEKLALLAILCVAFFLRFYCLTCSSYWHDEGNTWALVQRSFAQIAADAAADIHPPGYYWLLKLWSLVFGHGPWALRAFSAFTGALTVAVVYAIGKAVISDQLPVVSRQSPVPSHQSPVASRQSLISFSPLLVALLAALNPFQIFYSQEARMYSLLMLESAALVWVVLQEGRRQKAKAKGEGHTTAATPSQFTIHNSQFILSFALLAAAGLWTHYIFPVVLAAIFAAWLIRRTPFTIHNSQFTIHNSPRPFLLANLLALLLFLPWLPTAIERVFSWPAGGADVAVLDGLRLTLQTLAVGPMRSGPHLAWSWLLLTGALPLLGLWRLRRSTAAPFLALWLLTPIGLMFALGLFSDSFLKFLLVASPAWCLLVAGAWDNRVTRWQGDKVTHRGERLTFYVLRFTQYAIPLAALALAYAALPAYYADPTARDNYAGMAATVAALGDAATDLVIVDAPGQADVWRIYDPGVPLLALPRQRPPDRAETEAKLATAVANRSQIFALFWATKEADPQGIVEDWLNRNAFKGLEIWQGNVRFVHYTLPNQLACTDLPTPARFGAAIQLTRVCMPAQRALAAGTSLPLALHWTTDAPIDRRYKASVQLLNAQNQVVAQQDGEPGGGSLPTDAWQPGAEIVDKRGVYAPPGAPPVDYRLILALYDAGTGERLPVAGGDALGLGRVDLTRPVHPLPAEIVPMRARLDRAVGPLTLVGYDAYAKGYAHDPARPVAPGERLHVTLYWQAPSPLPAGWPDDLTLRLSLGSEQITAPLAGASFPTSAWQAADLVRGDVDIVYNGDGPLTLSVDGQDVSLTRVVKGRVQ